MSSSTQARTTLSASMTIRDSVIELGEGNPGAMNVMMQFIGDSRLPRLLLDLDDMNIRGRQIWVAFKDAAEQDREQFVTMVSERSRAMVDIVNRECMHDGFTERAVPHGASFVRNGARVP